ncbi:MAG TPA: universal stress protein [Synergistaceae bacterium]|nr:universal stress protein [Synergistaceae bacterium]
MLKKVLVAVDTSKMGDEVLEYGFNIAFQLGAEVTFIHVLPDPSQWMAYEHRTLSTSETMMDEIRESAQKKLNFAIRKKLERNPEMKKMSYATVVQQGNAGERIISYAKEHGFPLIVIGHRGHSAIERLFVGSTVTNVVRYAGCSVLVYRPNEEQGR